MSPFAKSLLVVAAVALSQAAQAVTITSTAAGYAGVSAGNCFGTANTVSMEIHYRVSSCWREGVVEVDISSVSSSSGATAILDLFDGAVGNSAAPYWTVEVYGYVGDLEVTGDDLHNGTYLTTAIWDRFGSGSASFAVDVSDFVAEQLALGTDVVGFSLRPDADFSCYICLPLFIYFDGSDADRPPTLTIVPAPPAAGLAGVSLGALLVIRRLLRVEL